MKKITPQQSNLPSSPARDGSPVTSPTLTPSLPCTRRFTRRALPLLYLSLILSFPFLTGCHSQQHVAEIVKTDTLHVYHTDTLKVVHNDTVYSVKVETKHDSIIIKEKYYLDSEGNVTHSEKEKETFHNFVKDAQFIQHTVDSLVQEKVDSIYQSKYNEKPVVVEVENPAAWYTKVLNWIVGKFACIGLGVVILVVLYFVWKRLKPKIP